jgi:hypothetical protein
VDLDSGQALTPACRAGHRTERRAYVVWPSQVRRFLSEQDRLRPELPPVAPGCQEGAERKAPRIRSPAAGHIAMLLRGVPASEQEIYVADTAGLSTRRKLEVRTRPRDPESGRDPTPPPRADRSICTPPCRSTWSPA